MTTVFDGLPGIFTQTFGQAVTLTVGGIPKEITGILRREGSVLDGLGIEAPPESATPELRAATEDVAMLKEGDLVEGVPIDAPEGALPERFRVVPPIEPDSRGMTRVRLEAV